MVIFLYNICIFVPKMYRLYISHITWFITTVFDIAIIKEQPQKCI